ncbi:hypothetical protein [Mycobacterium kiyosense]
METEGEYTIGAYYDADGKFELSTPVPMSIVLAEKNPENDVDDDDEAAL